MRIGLDIDGVMYKWDKTARYMLRDVLPNSPYKELLKQESQGWDWIKDNVAPEHWEWLWTEGVRLGLFRYGHLYPGTIQAVRTLAERGHEIVLITHRPKQAVTDTLAWLGMLDLPISGLHLLTNQEPKSLVRPGCEVYLDDKPENVEDLYWKADGAVCLMRRPWNKSYIPSTANIVEIFTWDGFVTAVEIWKEWKERK
jgi:uncharacterized HAD superfamily protein